MTLRSQLRLRLRHRLTAFAAHTGTDARNLAKVLRNNTVGGLLMLAAAIAAVLWANLAPVGYEEVSHTYLGPLSVAHWTSDGLLTIFFFVAGLELKRELTEGSLRRPLDALVPIVAAITGMVTPALLYLIVNVTLPNGDT